MPSLSAAELAQLVARRAEVIEEINSFNSLNSSDRKGAGINTSGDGVEIDHDQYLKTKYWELEKLEARIAAADGPFIEGLDIGY